MLSGRARERQGTPLYGRHARAGAEQAHQGPRDIARPRYIDDVIEFQTKLPGAATMWGLTPLPPRARDLRMRSVAEGVETAANLAAVRAAGYDEAQGFYFSLPVPARAVARTISHCEARFNKTDAAVARTQTKAAA